MPCIFWFGFPSDTFWAAAEHSHLEWQISFCRLSTLGQLETARLAKDLASLHVGICLFILPHRVSKRCLCLLKACILWIQCRVGALLPVLVLFSFIIQPSLTSSTAVLCSLMDWCLTVAPKHRQACEMGTRIWSYCMEDSCDTDQAIASK